MNCNNKYCIFSLHGQCCVESEADHNNATPNQLDCPSTLRKDIRHETMVGYKRAERKLRRLSLDNLIKVDKFIDSLAK